MNPAPTPRTIQQLKEELTGRNQDYGTVADLVDTLERELLSAQAALTSAQAALATKEAEVAKLQMRLTSFDGIEIQRQNWQIAGKNWKARAEKAEAELTTLNAERAETRDIRREMIRAQDEAAQLRAAIDAARSKESDTAS